MFRFFIMNLQSLISYWDKSSDKFSGVWKLPVATHAFRKYAFNWMSDLFFAFAHVWKRKKREKGFTAWGNPPPVSAPILWLMRLCHEYIVKTNRPPRFREWAERLSKSNLFLINFGREKTAYVDGTHLAERKSIFPGKIRCVIIVRMYKA